MGVELMWVKNNMNLFSLVAGRLPQRQCERGMHGEKEARNQAFHTAFASSTIMKSKDVNGDDM